jgi:cytochrome c oxidase subunit 3
MGTWGAMLSVIVLLMFLAGLAAAALYLHSGQPAWPPEGISRPDRTRAGISVLLALAAAGVLVLGRSRLLGGARRPAAMRLLLSLALHGAAIWVLAADLQAVGFRWDEHAYTSLYWVLTGMAMLALGTGALMVASVLIQVLTGVVDPARNLELDTTLVMVLFGVVTTMVLMALVHLLPSPGGA